jgi:hypothetical protein
MPELTPQSIATTPPPVPPIPPEVDPPAATPPVIDPAAWEAFPVFRESFLMYISEPSFNASLRTAAEHFFGMLLETYQHWPAWKETTTRTEMRAALGDLRHLQGFLASVGREREVSSLDPEDAYLSNIAAKLARQIGHATDGIERDLDGVRP